MTDALSACMKETGYLDKQAVKISAADVANAFQYFCEIYQDFREDNGLNKYA
jgi:hypothetical protein